MALKGWTQPATTFVLPGGGDVAVRGLSVDLVAALVREDRATLETLFAEVTGKPEVKEAAQALQEGEDAELPMADLGVSDVVSTALEHAPGLCAKVIAWSAGEPDAVEEARRIPFPTQFEMLVEIGRLTFEVTPMGKFLEAVIALTRSANVGTEMAKRLT